MSIGNYILIAVMLAFLGLGYKCYVHVESLKEVIVSKDADITILKEKIESEQKKMLVAQLESERYKAALAERTMAIELHSERYKLSQDELTKWRADANRYKNIERHLPPKEITQRNDCEDIKNYFDSLNGFSLDSLQ